jgi:hypothetical protein
VISVEMSRAAALALNTGSIEPADRQFVAKAAMSAADDAAFAKTVAGIIDVSGVADD